MSKLTVIVLIAFLIGIVAARPRKINSLYPGSYYQPKEPKAEPLTYGQPEVDRFFESFDNFEEDGIESGIEDEIEEPLVRELEQEEPEPSGRDLKEESEPSVQPKASDFPSARQSPKKFYEEEEPAASNLGYFRGYAPRSIVLTDDTTIESRFPFPEFPKLEFPFDKPFFGK